MPARFCISAAISSQVLSFPRTRNLGRLIRIDTYIDNIKVTTDVEAQFLEGFDQAVINQRTKHGTMVIAQDEQAWLGIEQIAQRRRLSIGLLKNQVGTD